MSSWSECLIPAGSNGCTTGIQSRKSYCVQETEDKDKVKPVSERFCTERQPLTSQVCQAECDLDCSVSQWTLWTECKVTDCELYLRRRRTNEGTGQRYRTRTILTEARGSGQRCPHLSETQTCDPQPCFKWNLAVGECNLLNPITVPACGLGIAYRTLSCMNKLGLRVADSRCEELSEKPSITEDCSIACPKDCILSDWSTWTQCPNLCQEERNRGAPKQTRERTILAQSGQGGNPCPPNRGLSEVRNCPTTIECTIYVWQADEWGPCTVRAQGEQCGPGYQIRHVSCYSLKGQLVNDQRCTLKVKPTTRQSCVVPCPVDCIVTEYSDWSSCSSTCFKASQPVRPKKTRVRYILQEPLYNGAPCPNILAEVKHCDNLTTCEAFYWDLGSWGPCTLSPNTVPHCGSGLQIRDASCRKDNGTLQPIDFCIHHVGPLPSLSQACFKSCDQDCKFEEWSPWSQCVDGCNGKRFRTRKLHEDVDYDPPRHCRDTRFYPLDSFERCLCNTYKAVPIGNWSECILEADGRFYRPKTFKNYQLEDKDSVTHSTYPAATYGVNAICGQGRRYKVLACQNEIGEVEAASKCSLKPYNEEMCLIPCPVDCVMSDWSSWTDCSTSCGTGNQLRYRHIKQIPSDGGRQCPSLDNAGKETQTRVCNTFCQINEWRAYKWSPCMPLYYGSVCGNGTQSRSVRCELFTIDGNTNEPLDDHNCISYLKPTERRQCYSPCEGECVVSEWSDWTRCKQPCADPNQVQTRRRRIMRNPSEDPLHACPSLLEERFCIRGDNCVEYNWKMTDWTTCLVNNGQDECGQGHKERYPVCQDQSGMIVADTECLAALGESSETEVVSCQVACDVDCLLTEWISWSECSSSCDLGQQMRIRDIVEEPKGNGRQCPDVFEQKKPCFIEGCYTWLVSPWSECINERGVCGHGIQTRNISCVANGGLTVNSSNCQPDLNIFILPLEQKCSIPCPGDCVLSDWSEWNSCFIDCRNFERPRFTRGVQSRSRAVLAYAQSGNIPCPEQLWESRPCEAINCFTMNWKTSSWTVNQTRVIWCERSDGLYVTGGCNELLKPAEILTCNPSCSVKNSYCNDTNYCTCLENYEPTFNRLKVLIECSRMDNSTDSNPASDSVTLPTDGPTNAWMYAVIAVATLFIIFLAVACYTMSEFFHKGPRPRNKRGDDKSIEGADRVDGVMIAETELGTCNHVPHGAPIIKSDVDRVSVNSTDRCTSPISVRAPACDSHNTSMSEHSLNDDSPQFNEHYTVMHEHAHLNGNTTQSGDLHVSCKTSNSKKSNNTLNECCVVNDLNKNVEQPNSLTDVKQALYSEVNPKSGKISSILKTVNPVMKPARADSTKSKTRSSNDLRTSMNSNSNIEDENYNEHSPLNEPKASQCFDSHAPGNNVLFSDDIVRPLNEQKLTADESKVELKEINKNRNVDKNGDKTEKDICTKDDTKTKRNSLHEMLKSYFDRTLNNDSKIDIGSSETEKLLPDTALDDTKHVHDESNDQFDETGKEAMIVSPSNRTRRSTRPPPLFTFKSQSLEQAEKDMMYDSDDSIGKAMSLRSQSSMRSRISRISNLSVSTGPAVKIDPDESLPATNKCNVQSVNSNIMHKKKNIGYIAFSSFDTETSEPVSSSVSCDSLSSPRSLPSETQSDKLPAEQYRLKTSDNHSDKAPRNVAIGSLSHKRKHPARHILDDGLDHDSGVGSLPKNINGTNEQSKSPVSLIRLANSVPAMSHSKPSYLQKFDQNHNNADELFTYDKDDAETLEHNNRIREADSPELMKPYQFLDVKAKRCALKKQTGSEFDEFDC
ncbi:Thrombospondin type 1 repeat-containing protein [Mactra antiquata]